MASEETVPHVLVIGGGPGGNTAASTAATLGARVTMVEDQIIGGAAHLLDCIPSKAMISGSMRLRAIRNSSILGVSEPGPVELDMAGLSRHVTGIADTSLPRSRACWRARVSN